KGDSPLTHFENFTEDSLEKAVIETLQEMDYEYAFGPDLSVGGPRPERKDYREVILAGRLRDTLYKLNQDLPPDAIEDVYRRVITFNSLLLSKTTGISINF
uniref:type I restriction endonuclease n=1 Tax=Caldifermentibacillus hisashii TaxID=996558 RepID=UPI0038CFFF0D